MIAKVAERGTVYAAQYCDTRTHILKPIQLFLERVFTVLLDVVDNFHNEIVAFKRLTSSRFVFSSKRYARKQPRRFRALVGSQVRIPIGYE